jgi:3-phenylpropionate/trans-cinnamate dioxygenase ferredoxin reductase subunit
LTTGNPEKFVFRDAEWFKNADIDVINDSVYAIHSDIKKLAMQKGEAISYDKLLIATGVKPRQIDVPGKDANHIYYLKFAAD